MIAKKISNRGGLGVLDDAVLRHRHLNLSIVLLTQSFRGLNPNMRSLNVHGLVILRTNKVDLKKIAEEHANLLDTDDFIELCEDAFKYKP